MHRLSSYFGTLLAALFVSANAHAAESVTGTWEWADKHEASGHLALIQEGTTVRFQLQLQAGPPGYNMGIIGGEFELKNGEGIFFSDENGPCQLTFTFDAKSVVIKTDPEQTECGFGNGVYADGTFPRTSAKTPTFEEW
ncbi:hypothetical protein C7S18_20530 [Ahniella affigens]|uniref:Uncharacterized protein n=1 Tax=Ahniella affigens TaxID=2021234 RepID=A0A2P1PX57_9GAMM|nr:hypothetical protein [Ahniella affigens]AVP99410.1 hypothetical protein C7S18_20530 [Ahniella affigens]